MRSTDGGEGMFGGATTQLLAQVGVSTPAPRKHDAHLLLAIVFLAISRKACRIVWF